MDLDSSSLETSQSCQPLLFFRFVWASPRRSWCCGCLGGCDGPRLDNDGRRGESIRVFDHHIREPQP